MPDRDAELEARLRAATDASAGYLRQPLVSGLGRPGIAVVKAVPDPHGDEFGTNRLG